jgi:glycosyltransferase involved in cell wall biosynthesis
MRLGIYHEPVHTDGHTFDTYGPYARYVLEFARRFEHVTVFAPATSDPTYFSGCPLNRPNLTVIPLPYFETHVQAYRHAVTIARIFRRHAGSLDVINCRGTAPLAYLLWWFTRRRNVPFIYHFAADPFEVLDRSPVYCGIYGKFARFAYGIEFAIQKYIMRRNFSFVSGTRLCEQLRRVTPSVEPVLTSSLKQEDYYLRQDCCTSDNVRLLYVGRLKAGKGLEHLIEAVGILNGSGRNSELDIVGEGDLLPSLSQLAQELNVSDYVRFHGFVVMGPELNEYYNSADIFVLPSLSEGSPKAVLEALAHSLPVVATVVGNIPTMLDQGRRGILIPLRDPSSIAQAVIRVVDDPAFRQACIRDGYNYAKEHSAGKFIARMAEKARSLVEERRKGVST